MPIELADGAKGELVLTHLQHRAAPLLRFRTRDHVQVWTSPCACGRTSPRMRCIGRTDDMLIVRGVNVFPSAVREVVGAFAPRVSGHILVRPQAPGVKQEPPLPVSVELARGARAGRRARGGDPRQNPQRARRPDTRGPRAVGNPGAQRVQVEARRVPGSLRCESSRARASTTSRIVGADRQTSIDFWEGVLGMPFVFEQPNLDNESESHLYFDPGDGRLITVFTNEERAAPTRPGRRRTSAACTTSRSRSRRRRSARRWSGSTSARSGTAASRTAGSWTRSTSRIRSVCSIELASYRFEPPFGYTHADVLLEAHKLRVERGDYNIAEEHLADAIETLVRRSRGSLSDDRSAKDPYN